MQDYELTNGRIAVRVSAKGAELRSLKDCNTGEEYLWNADPAYWNRISPLLFPFIGGLKNGSYRYEGKEYRMEKHGFVRDAVFQTISMTDTEIWFRLEADEETLVKYPFAFRLEAGYRLEDRTVVVMWKVSCEDKEMFFSIGGHPAFLCPRQDGERQTDYALLVDKQDELINTVIGDDGLRSGGKVTIPLNQGILTLTEHLFDRDALILEDNQIGKITFLDTGKNPYVTVRFDSPAVGIWSQPKMNAPFICVEPWYGICDATDFTGTLQERKWGNHVLPGEIFEKQYTIEI